MIRANFTPALQNFLANCQMSTIAVEFVTRADLSLLSFEFKLL